MDSVGVLGYLLSYDNEMPSGVTFPKSFNIILYHYKFYDIISVDVAKVILILLINIFGNSGRGEVRNNIAKFSILDDSRGSNYVSE